MTKKLDRVDLSSKNVWLPCTGAALLCPAAGRKIHRRASGRSSFPPRHRTRRQKHPRRRRETTASAVVARGRTRCNASAKSFSPIDIHRLLHPRRTLRARLHSDHDRRPRAGRRRKTHRRRLPPPQSPNSSPPPTSSASSKLPRSVARKPSPRSPTARKPFPAWKKSSALAIATSPPQSNSSAATAPSICPPARPKRLSSPTDGKRQRKWIAADLLAQAEHAPDAGSFLVTTSHDRWRASPAANRKRSSRSCPKTNPAHTSIAQDRRDPRRAIRRRRLRIRQSLRSRTPQPSGNDRDIAAEKHAPPQAPSSLGPWAAQPLGDYASGSNHVLPTGGWARTRGGLSAADFVKCITVQPSSAPVSTRLADDVQATRQRGRPASALATPVEVRR